MDMTGGIDPLRELNRWQAVAREQYVRRVREQITDTSASPFPFAELQSILGDYDDPVVFLHIGLSDVAAAFGSQSYDRLRSELARQFESVLVPGFTPSFRASGVYHKRYSKPQVGAFSRLFLADAEYRTDDPIHSILVGGDYRFEGCDHRDTFGENGCYAQLDSDNVLIANIGTNRLVSTPYHYISLQAETPYHTTETHSGVIYYDEDTHERITQRNDTFTGIYNWSRWKMETYLEEQGVLDSRDRNGLKLSFFRANDMRNALEPMIEQDPFYMVA
ncbi:AAC(3) family N-acetyltransferase [Halobellus sp. GM3]|uniref:AAC(3) family N-acetyltransferase n=1 Tax=Halobellus sp. GM3 TaxID=3458410 RepID=UPI00403DABB1